MPKISVITVNLNNAVGLQRTISSVLNQKFGDFEYIIIDGGSKDTSVEQIASIQDRLAYWITEKDEGVYQAMNKAIRVAKGDYLLFLNSGDHLFNNSLFEEVVSDLDGKDIVYGNLHMIEGEKEYIAGYPDQLSFTHFVESNLPHPGSFIKRTLLERLGGYDESLKICSDWRFFMDAICRYNASFKHIDKTIAVFYLDGLSSKLENVSIIRDEKQRVLYREYALFMPLYEAYRKASPIPVKKATGLLQRIRYRVGI